MKYHPQMTTPVRTSYHHGDLRNSLVEAARALIAELGPEGFTLREVARQVGVNHRAAYRHFEDKRALLAAVAQQGYEALIVETRAALLTVSTQSLESQLNTVLRQYVSFAIAHPAEFVVMMGPRLNLDLRFPELEKVVWEAFNLTQELVRQLVGDSAQASMRTRDMTVGLLSMAHGLANLVLMDRIHVKPGQLLAFTDRLVQGALHGFLHPERT